MEEMNEQMPETVSAEEFLTEPPETPADPAREELKSVLEAVVYVLNEPKTAAEIAVALGREPGLVASVLQELAQDTQHAARGVLVREVAGGYQMVTKPEHHEIIRTFVQNLKQPLKLSQAALETLAVVAYKQPVTGPEIQEIRGVSGVGVLKTLLDRRLITTAGRKNVIGKPILYRTTKDFLTQFGLRDINELPTLKEFEEIRRQSLADDEITPEAPAAPTAEAAPDTPVAAAAGPAAVEPAPVEPKPPASEQPPAGEESPESAHG